jgi:hypothetical protein
MFWKTFTPEIPQKLPVIKHVFVKLYLYYLDDKHNTKTN